MRRKNTGEVSHTRISRRELLKQTGAILGMAAFPSILLPNRTQAQTALGNASISFTPPEAETLRAIISRIIPADENGPGALEARADRFIDRALAGVLKAERPAYKAGLAAVNAYAQSSKGMLFAKLRPADQDEVLTDVEQNRPLGFVGNSSQFFNLVRTHTIQGTFSDPYYGGNANFVGWELIGYPGARVVVSANLQRIDVKPEPSRKSAYDYGMFNKGEI
jgi:gluconate 2-dehydrogenase gamma chain